MPYRKEPTQYPETHYSYEPHRHYYNNWEDDWRSQIGNDFDVECPTDRSQAIIHYKQLCAIFANGPSQLTPQQMAHSNVLLYDVWCQTTVSIYMRALVCCIYICCNLKCRNTTGPCVSYGDTNGGMERPFFGSLQLTWLSLHIHILSTHNIMRIINNIIQNVTFSVLPFIAVYALGASCCCPGSNVCNVKLTIQSSILGNAYSMCLLCALFEHPLFLVVIHVHLIMSLAHRQSGYK